MSTSSVSTLEEAIRDAGEGWLIDRFSPPEGAIPYLRQVIATVHEQARQRFGENSPKLSEDALIENYRQHRTKVKGFLQVLSGTRTPDMLLMAWRIIQGMEIKEVTVSYHRKQDFRLRVVLELPYGGSDEIYESTKIQDFALFRHIGIMEIDGKPVFDGFYALNLK